MTTTNPYLVKCAALASRNEPESKKEEGQEGTVSFEKSPTVASIAKEPGAIRNLHLDNKNPTLNDISKPY